MTQKVDTLFTNAIVLTMDGKLNQYDPGAVSVDMELTNHNDTDFKMNLKVLDLLQSFNHNCVL